MAKRLASQKRSEYHCPPKACPRPADLARFPGIMAVVRKEWAARIQFCRSGNAKRRRATAKCAWPGRKKAKR